MVKASRARLRLGIERGMPSTVEPTARAPNERAMRPLVADLCELLDRAEREGLRSRRAARWRLLITSSEVPPAVLARCERRLRAWVFEQAERRGA